MTDTTRPPAPPAAPAPPPAPPTAPAAEPAPAAQSAPVGDRPHRLLLAAYAACSVLDLTAITARLPVLVWVAKPLLAPLLAAAVLRGRQRRRGVLAAGLACAAAGDTALLVPGRAAFLLGMAAFLAMHLCYIAAFRAVPARSPRGLRAGYAALWLLANALLAPRLAGLALPVAGYSAALLTMAATASRLGRYGVVGGALFAVSDLMIGADAAGAGFPGRAFLVMASYTAAQALLVAGFRRRAPLTPRPAAHGPRRDGEPDAPPTQPLR